MDVEEVRIFFIRYFRIILGVSLQIIAPETKCVFLNKPLKNTTQTFYLPSNKTYKLYRKFGTSDKGYRLHLEIRTIMNLCSTYIIAYLIVKYSIICFNASDSMH